MSKKQFVEGILSETFAEGFGYIKALEYNEEAEEVAIVCNNNYRYYVNVACDSKAGIIADVTKEAMRH